MFHETESLLVSAVCLCCCCFFFFQAEDGIRDLVRSRGLGDVYKRQVVVNPRSTLREVSQLNNTTWSETFTVEASYRAMACLLYTSDAADDLLCVDLGGRRIIKKKNKQQPHVCVRHDVTQEKTTSLWRHE